MSKLYSGMMRCFLGRTLTLWIMTLPVMSFGQNIAPSPFDTIFMPTRAPLFFSYGLFQKSFKKPDIILDDPGQVFNPLRTHSIGVLFKLEYALNSSPNFDRLMTLETNLGFSSYSLRANVFVHSEDFGLDDDINQRIYHLASATEMGFKLNQYRRLSKKSYVIAGMGFNIQSIPFHNTSMNNTGLVIQDGEPRQVTLVHNADERGLGFGPSREDAPHRLGFVASAGIGWQTKRYNMVRLDFRYSSTRNGDITDQLFSDFGLGSEIIINKSYIGLNFSYLFCVNHRRAKESIIMPD